MLQAVFVVGFHEPVRTEIERHFADRIEDKSIIWIAQVPPKNYPDFDGLSNEYFLKVDTGTRSTLVLTAIQRGREWLEQSIAGIIESAKESYPDVECEFINHANPGDAGWVIDSIADFNLAPINGTISECQVRSRIGDGKVFCASKHGCTSFLSALERAGFSAEAIASCFTEQRIGGGKNSSLMQQFEAKAKQYGHMLYAWGDLRTSTPKVRDAFIKFYEARNAASTVELFRKWIMGQDG
jgi:hypothetical protein